MIILHPACPVCGQDVRNPEWASKVGDHELRLAYESNLRDRLIGRRSLRIGERSVYDAVSVAGVDASGKRTYRSAGRMLAPPGWIDRLERAMRRAAEALGWELITDSMEED